LSAVQQYAKTTAAASAGSDAVANGYYETCAGRIALLGGVLHPYVMAHQAKAIDVERVAARDWFGYGRWDAPYWFIEPEPGLKKGITFASGAKRGPISVLRNCWIFEHTTTLLVTQRTNEPPPRGTPPPSGGRRSSTRKAPTAAPHPYAPDARSSLRAGTKS